jgi:hypothetical protein
LIAAALRRPPPDAARARGLTAAGVAPSRIRARPVVGSFRSFAVPTAGSFAVAGIPSLV